MNQAGGLGLQPAEAAASQYQHVATDQWGGRPVATNFMGIFLPLNTRNSRKSFAWTNLTDCGKLARMKSDSSRTSFANSYLILVAFQTISLHIGSICCNHNTQEHMLIDHLIGNYDSTIRPVQNPTTRPMTAR